MCAALAAREDPAEELEFAVDLINRVLDGVAGDAHRPARLPRQLEPRRAHAAARRLRAARALPRAHAVAAARARVRDAARGRRSWSPFGGKELGLGVVNPRTDAVESRRGIAGASSAALRARSGGARSSSIRTAASARSSSRPMNSAEVASRRLAAMAQAAHDLRG